MFSFLEKFARDRFARRVQRAIARVGGPADLTYDPASFTLKRDGMLLNLGNGYRSWRQKTGLQRERIFHNLVTAFVSPRETFPDYEVVRPRLVAALRERALFGAAESTMLPGAEPAPPKNRLLAAACSEWYARTVVIDFPTHVTILSESHLKQWNVTFDEVFAQGLGYLRDCTIPKFRSESGYHVGTWNDDYDSSRPLVPGLFDDLPLRGNPVVCLPNRNTLLVAGSDETEALRAMFAKAEDIVRTLAKPQNPAPLLVTTDGLHDFVVSANSPLHAELDRIRLTTASTYYAEQKAALDALYQKQGKDVFVATFQLRAKDSLPTSIATWTRGVPTLLPVANQVVFMDPERPEKQRLIGLFPWPRVCEVLGDRMLETQLFPPRYYVSTFPSADELARLTA